MTEPKTVYTIRLPGGLYQPEKGEAPTSFIPQAKHFTDEAKAQSAAKSIENAVGVSCFQVAANGQVKPLQHLPLTIQEDKLDGLSK